MLLASWITWGHKKIVNFYLGICSISLKFPRPSLEAQFGYYQAQAFVTCYRIAGFVYSILCVGLVAHQVMNRGRYVHVGLALALSVAVIAKGNPSCR